MSGIDSYDAVHCTASGDAGSLRASIALVVLGRERNTAARIRGEEDFQGLELILNVDGICR